MGQVNEPRTTTPTSGTLSSSCQGWMPSGGPSARGNRAAHGRGVRSESGKPSSPLLGEDGGWGGRIRERPHDANLHRYLHRRDVGDSDPRSLRLRLSVATVTFPASSRTPFRSTYAACMRIAITGGTGFVGGHLATALSSGGTRSFLLRGGWINGRGRQRYRDSPMSRCFKPDGGPPFGFRASSGELLPEPSEQLTLARLKDLRSQGLTLREVCARLDAEELRPRRGGCWSEGSLSKIVRRSDLTPGS